MQKILVALSGGVDSTITALRLQKANYEVIGCYMVLHDDLKSHEENIAKVKRVSEYLGIKYHILYLQDEFKKEVYEPFIKTYQNGATPNPCVRCNRLIKFGKLIEFAKTLGCEKIATGHYVRINNGKLQEAVDKSKDQSYFLSNIKPEALNFMLFPLGESVKTQIKEEAKNIPALSYAATQKESSEICFVPESYVDILKQHMQVNLPGDVLDIKGNIIGKHKGYMHYTIGKRRGFEIKGALKAHYVISINAKNNTITVGSLQELECKEFKINDLNFFIEKEDFKAEVKIRYRSEKMPCKVILSEDKSEAKVLLEKSVNGVAKGQRAVFYHGDLLIASGEIL